VRLDVVGTHPEHDGVSFLESAVVVPERARLRSATGGVVLGVEVEDDRPPAE
jgi:hypothetical protein